jgi:TP901 family phage tail tape measure protein
MADIQSNIRVNIDTNSAVASLKVLQGQISAFHQEMSRSGALAASEMSRLQNNFMNAVNRTGQFDARLKTIRTTTESFTDALEKNKLSMGQYFRYAGAATKDFGKLFKGEFDTIEKVARERVKDLQTQYIKMGRDANGAMKAMSIRPLVLDLDDLSTKTQIAAQKQQLLNQLLKQGSTNMLNWGKNTQWAGRQLMVGFTVPLTMLGQITAKTFMEMEQSVIKFQRVYGDFGTTAEQTKQMTTEVTNLAKAFTKYGLAVSDTVGMAADAAAMGKQGADLLAQVESASRLSVLGGVDQKQALETTISLTNAFGIAADQLTNKINFLNVVENQTVTSIEDLTIAVPKAAPVIKQLGGNVEDLAFFLTAMKEGGINASEGANALKSGIASIINPTKKASDMLSGFGINIKGIVDANKGDVKGMIMGVAEALNSLDPLKRAQAIEQLFGKFQFARISTLFQNITDANSQATKVAELAAQGPGAAAVLAQRELKKIEESPMFKFKKALEDLKVELIPLGEQFLKAVTPIAKFFTDVLKNFNNMSSGTKDFIGGITMVLAGIGPVVLMVVGLIANGVANLIKMFAGIKSFFNNLGKGAQDLGSQTNYMTQEQIEAQAVASSLNQTHSKLTQTFTAEAGAIANLRREMERAVAIQGQFGWTPGGVAGKGKKGKKMANGGVVQGPGGPKDDAVPTNLSNGEVVLSVDTVKKNPGIIAALLQGQKINIPGFADSGVAGQRTSGAIYGGQTLQLTGGGLFAPGNSSHSKMGLNKDWLMGSSNVESSMMASAIGGSAALGGDRITKKLVDDYAAEMKDDIPKIVAALRKAVVDIESTGESIQSMEQVTQKAKPELDKVFADMKSRGGISARAATALTEHSMFPTEEAMRSPMGETRAAASRFSQSQGIVRGTMYRVKNSPMLARTKSAYKHLTGEAVPKDYTYAHLNEARVLGENIPLSGGGLAAPENEKQELLAMQQRGQQKIIDQYGGGSGIQLRDVSKSTVKSGATTQAGAAIAAKVETQIADATNVAAQAQSPSRKTMQAGKNLADGAIVGINEAGPAFKKSVADTAKNAFVISPASAQYAREQMKKMLKPFTDSNGLVDMGKLNAAQQVRVHLITQEEKNMRANTQMLLVADKLAHPFRNTIQAIGDAAFAAKDKVMQGVNGIKNFAMQTPAMLRNAMTTAGVALKTGVEKMKVSITQLAQKLQQTAARIGKGVVGQLGSGKAMMATAAVMGTLSMMPGKVGEIANAILMPLMMIQSIIALIPAGIMSSIGAALLPLLGPILAIAAPLVILGGLIAFSIWQNAENNKKAAQFGNALAVSAESVKKFGELTGRVGTTEALQAESDARRAGLSGAADLELGKQYVDSEQGKADVANLQYLKDSNQLTPAQVAQQYSATLAQAITQGTLTLTEANSIAAAVGKQLGDSAFSINVSSQLTELLGPDGKDLLKNPLEVTTKLVQANTANADYLLEGATFTKEDIAAEKQMNFDQLYGNKTNLKGEKLKPGEQYTEGNITYTAPTLDAMSSTNKVGAIKAGKEGDVKAAYTAMLGSYGSIETTRDTGLKAIDDKIQEAKDAAAKETNKTKKAELEAEVTRLENSREDDRAAIIASTNAQRTKLFDTGKLIDDKGTFNTAVEEKFANAEQADKDIANKRKDEINAVGNSSLRQILQGGMLSDTLGVTDQQMITKMAGGTGGEAFSNAFVGATGAMGDRGATEFTAALQARGAQTPAITSMLKDTKTNAAGYEAAMQDQTVMKMDLSTAEAQTKLQSFAKEFTDTKNKLKNIPETKLVATAVTDKKVAKLIEQSKVFKGLNKQQKITYLAKYNASMKLQGDPALDKAWKEWSKGKTGDVSFPAFARYLAGEAATKSGGGDTSSEKKDDGGNGGGSTAPTKTDKANAALSILGRKEEAINKAYDERLKALDKIQQANDKINQQKKDQLDLADALSRGDIGAAARAQQQARQNAQATALQEQRDQMNAAREAQIASLRVNGMSREQLQAFLDKEQNKADSKTLGGWHLATGGLVPNTQYLALGGKPKGTDTIAAMLTPGEFVVKKSAVDKIGAGNMSKINRGEIPAGRGGSVYNYSINVSVKSDADAEQIAQTVITKIKAIDNQGMKGDRA